MNCKHNKSAEFNVQSLENQRNALVFKSGFQVVSLAKKDLPKRHHHFAVRAFGAVVQCHRVAGEAEQISSSSWIGNFLQHPLVELHGPQQDGGIFDYKLRATVARECSRTWGERRGQQILGESVGVSSEGRMGNEELLQIVHIKSEECCFLLYPSSLLIRKA